MHHPRICLLALLLVLAAHALTPAQPIHLQTPAEQQAYLDELMKIESSLKQGILQLELMAGSVNKNVSAYEGLPTIQTQTLETGIFAEREALNLFTSQLVLPLDKKKWACAMLTPAEVDAINRQISESQKNLGTLQQKVGAEPDCQRNTEIQIDIEFLSLYIDHLAKQVGSNCANTTTVPKNIYVPSSKNQYYIYGSQGEQAYNTNIQNLLSQQYTKIECPPELPYPSNNVCVGCPQDKLHYFDLTQMVCLTCPSDYIFDVATRSCTKKTYNSNTQAGNYIGGLPVPVPGLETCPWDKPFFNGAGCIGCPAFSFFDYGSMICKICPPNTIFDPSTHLCVYKKYNSFISQDSKNYCCGTLAFDPTADVCPRDRPFFNGKECIACALPAYYNIQTLICSLCPEGQGFSLAQGACIDKRFFQTVYTTVISSNVQNYYGTPPKTDPAYQNVTACPADHPYSTGQTCIQCQLPSYFNFEILACQNCPPDFRFDVSTHKCQKMLTTQLNSNMIVVNNFIGTIPSFNSQLATCPNDQPFFNGVSCIACALPNYVDFGTMTCKTCPAGFSFNVDNRECVVMKPQFYTNIKANNIYYNGDFNTVVHGIESLKSGNPGIQECPPETPFFDYQRNACITCSSEFPLFDYKYNRCITCAGQSFYNIESRMCLQDGKVSATVERMIMNTVGWI